jgi:hypothetical protein
VEGLKVKTLSSNPSTEKKKANSLMIQTIRDHGEVEQLAKETKNKQKLR